MKLVKPTVKYAVALGLVTVSASALPNLAQAVDTPQVFWDSARDTGVVTQVASDDRRLADDDRRTLPWAEAEGRPDFRAGRSVGFYIWHEGNTVTIVDTNESDRGQLFSGTVQVEGGTLFNPRRLHDEHDDRISQPAPSRLSFGFKTARATDGVKFDLSGGRRLVLHLDYLGHATEHIFVGARSVEAEHDPVVFNLERRSEVRSHPRAWSEAAGRPDIEAGRSIGFFIWHEGNTVFLKTTNEADKVQPFAGRITVDGGTIAHPRRLNDERDDRLRRTGPNTLDFRFETAEGVDGLKFDLRGGQRVVFHLDFLGHPTQNIFFGGREIEAHEDPLVFDLNR